MLRGIFWFDGGTPWTLEQAVARAAACFRTQFRREPTLCMLPPGMLQGNRSRLGHLAVRPNPSLPPHYIWIGTEDAEPRRDSASRIGQHAALRAPAPQHFRRRAPRTHVARASS